MYFPLTIDSKRIFTLPSGSDIVDLTEQNLKFKAEEVSIIDSFYCASSSVMRPDFLSQLYYNDTDRTEFILKFNNISNPFSLNEGDVVLIPDSFSAREKFKVKNKYEELREKVRNQFIDESKLTSKDPTLTEFTKRQSVNLPPNYAKEGDKEIVVENGVIKFGPNVSRKQKSQNLDDSKLTAERTSFLEKMKNLKNG